MTTEDFSFPTITDSYPYSIDSPPLWHLSPAASPDVVHYKSMRERERGEKEDDDRDCFVTEEKQRKSCSYIEKGSKMSRRVGNAEDGTEKMDLLWENFNEELSRSCSSRMDYGDMMGLGCVQALKLSKTSGGMFSSKKPSVVVLFKSFRKLFLLHRSHNRG
ncbi:hypothetical protein SLE2022_237740 [Rubroshorea leprosula]